MLCNNSLGKRHVGAALDQMPTSIYKANRVKQQRVEETLNKISRSQLTPSQREIEVLQKMFNISGSLPPSEQNIYRQVNKNLIAWK